MAWCTIQTVTFQILTRVTSDPRAPRGVFIMAVIHDRQQGQTISHDTSYAQRPDPHSAKSKDRNCLFKKLAAATFCLYTADFIVSFPANTGHSMLFLCWASVEGADPTLKQHLSEDAGPTLNSIEWMPRVCWVRPTNVNVDDAGPTLNQHWLNVWCLTAGISLPVDV